MIVPKSKIKKEELIYPIKFYLKSKSFMKELIVHVDESQCMDFFDWLNRNKYNDNIQSWEYFIFDDINTKEHVIIMRNEIQAFKMPRFYDLDADNYKIQIQIGGF